MKTLYQGPAARTEQEGIGTMEPNRPRGRERNITGSGSVQKRGEGLHSGPVGAGRGKPSGGGSPGSRAGGEMGGAGAGLLLALLLRNKKLALILIVIVVIGAAAFLLLGGPNAISGLSALTPSGGPAAQSAAASPSGSAGPGNVFGGLSGGGSHSSGWDGGDNTGKLNLEVAPGAREKRTRLLGDGRDTVTVMVYMCGTDLESKYGMGTADLQEMLAARLSEQVNLLVFTGGCKAWKNDAVSSAVNQIYKIENGTLKRLEADAGTAAMTDPANLTRFITYCHQNYPANREMLILWDHGGGSVTGYGYDEKNPGGGSMTLAGIDQALSGAGVSFDFIGFDACLMATVETALTMEKYGDYLIASEETEPGVGWYYTDWLTALSANPSMSTLEIGKAIADSFVDVCAQKCRGQKTTLSVVDLAEAAATIPGPLDAFAQETTRLIERKEFKAVSDARFNTREFAQSSAIDQVDLVHLAQNMKTGTGGELAAAVLRAVKYNRASSDMTNAYGLSAYFPCKTVARVDSAVRTYQQVGLSGDYARCVQAFASMEISGQAAGGGAAASPLAALLGGGPSTGGGGDVLQLIGGLMSGGGMDFFSGRALDPQYMAGYIEENRFDPSALTWSGAEKPVIRLDEDQWALVQDAALNVFYDDGAGYIDLGLDNILSFDETGALEGVYDGAWMAIGGQVVPYYYESTMDDGTHYTITGRVPALLNGERVNLIVVCNNAAPSGYIAGAVRDYRAGETETVAKSVISLRDGDTLDFICDYYGYDGSYQDSYLLGEQLTVSGEPAVSDLLIDAERCSAAYRFTDIYQQHYWTETIPQ